jgi:integrase
MREDISLLYRKQLNSLNLTFLNFEGHLQILIEHLQRRSYSPARIKKYRSIYNTALRQGINPMKATPKQIDNFFFHVTGNGYADWTRRDYWIVFRRIVLFYNPKFAKVFSAYRIQDPKDHKVDVLTMHEINQIINASHSMRNSCMFSVLYEGGLRVQELQSISASSTIFDGHGAIIQVEGKTGVRCIRLVQSARQLKELLKENPHPFNVSETFINKRLKELAARVGIKKRIYPHLLRHTRATHLATHLTDREMCLFFGWAEDSGMPRHYSHLSMRDLDQKMISLAQRSYPAGEEQAPSYNPLSALCKNPQQTGQKEEILQSPQKSYTPHKQSNPSFVP